MSNWKRTSEKLPEDGEHVYCLPQGLLLTWNEYHGVWDDDEGDDYFCDKDSVESWCPIPEYDLKDE